ncbi:uncharacterized protein LOC111042047 [Myzus persicae]|uniref:uncharacterized protein LOC111042047 n=1 Tax=Myzus persicae TaxID=13164 RepID=UPI000B93947D|nr:uncharacterized protein LOC111042047 [Myzus persicae]
MDSDAVDDNQIIGDKKVENKMYKINVHGKSILKTNMKKRRLIKEQVKTYFEDMSFKKLNRGISYTHVSNKEKLYEEVPKLTNIHLRSESRRASILSDLADSASVLQPTLPGLLIENLGKIKKKDVTEKKKTLRKKKDDKEEKVSSNGTISTSINIENVPFDKDSSVVVGDNLVVYYGDITYDAKVIYVCDIEGVMKYYVHYEGWNVRYDEWIDDMHIAYKKKEQEPEEDIDADSSKSSIEIAIFLHVIDIFRNGLKKKQIINGTDALYIFNVLLLHGSVQHSSMTIDNPKRLWSLIESLSSPAVKSYWAYQCWRCQRLKQMYAVLRYKGRSVDIETRLAWRCSQFT